MSEAIGNLELAGVSEVKDTVQGGEFFERTLFNDILGMESLRQVSEATAVDLDKLQDQTYQCLFNLYQQTRGIDQPNLPENDQVFVVFELFFKNFYQHFRLAIEDLIKAHSPLKVAYFLGKNSEKMQSILEQVVKEMVIE